MRLAHAAAALDYGEGWYEGDPAEQRIRTVRILDIWNGRWVIVNVLWELKPVGRSGSD